MGILASYIWIFQELSCRGHQVHILLKHSEAEYTKPVEEDLLAICHAPRKEDFDQFIKTSDGAACILKGEFVAQAVR